MNGSAGRVRIAAMVTIYTKTGCPYCAAAKEDFAARGVKFTEINLTVEPKLIPEILGTLVRLREERGMSVLLAEQNAREALQVVDRGYVLKNGRITLEGTAAELRENAEVKAAYLGL